jgi:hypothetical protein
MGVLLSAILVGVLLAQLITCIFLRFEEGSPAKDKDILEMLEKASYTEVKQKWDNTFFIEAEYRNSNVPRIYKNHKWFIYYPYTIEGVGVVPRWYKSRKIIDAKFKELIKGSRYDNNKRKKLGLE